MTILAFDLAYNGPTGWTVWSPRLDDPVLAYGDFQPDSPSSKLTGGQRDMTILIDLSAKIGAVIRSHPTMWLAYEYTDWHRNLNARGKNWKAEYAIERKAQWSLGMSVAALLLTAHSCRVYIEKIIDIGANEAKREFGAARKDAAARLFADEYPRFTFVDDSKEGYLFDTTEQRMVSDHISDAFVIAKVAASRVRMGELATK